MGKGWLLYAAFGVSSLLAGCHSAGNGAAQQRDPAPSFHPGRIPTPPTADQIDPNSPAAVLHGTSTTQSQPRGARGASGSTAPQP